MNKLSIFRQILLAPPTVRSSLLITPPRAFFPGISRPFATAPNVAQTSFWVSLIPKPFRNRSPSTALKKKIKSNEWNPATFFIIIFLLIGSMSIQMIALRNEFSAFSRRADAKIGLLKEVIERIQKGEEVDVEGLLGTGNKEQEKEWEDVLEEIQREDQAWEKSQKSKPTRDTLEKSNSPTKTQDTKTSVESSTQLREANPRPVPKAPPGFY